MLSKCYCCKTSNVSDNQEEYGDRETEAIYNATKKGNTDIKEDEGQQDDKEQNTYDDHDDDEDIDAFKMLKMFTKKCGTNGAKSVEISDRVRKFRRKNDDSFDTLLHTAALFNKDPRIVDQLMTCCPDLINKPRTGSYKGQTALHITIAKEKMEATEAILMNLKNKQIFEMKATGSKFKNNIVMGETVLSVAVLTLNTNMVDLLLKYGAPIHHVNTKGDTVIHTLIKYAKFIPDKTTEVIKMINHLNKKIFEIVDSANVQKDVENAHSGKESIIEKMWFGENNYLKTPLKLAVAAGLIDIFQAMMKIKNVFYFPSNYDGSYDTRYYDITEIDPVTQYQFTNLEKQETVKKNMCFQTLKCLFNYDRPLSIIEMLSTIEWKKAQPFVDTSQIKRLISRRWRFHRYIFSIFAFIHISVMILFTTSIFYRKYVLTECNSLNNDCQCAKMYANVTPWVLVIYSVAVLFFELYRLLVLRQIWWPHKHHNNSWYRASLILFASGLFVDAYLYQLYQDSNDIIFIVLILGCWFLFFFLKGSEKFSAYTVLFQKVIMGDLFRFGLIIGIEFTACSYAMYIVLRGNGDVKEFSNFENTTLTMFSYMLGLKDLSILDHVESKTQRLVVVIYVLFIISTYILLLNTLIAMMNGTSGTVFDNRKLISKLQKYTVVQFLDAFFLKQNLRCLLVDDKPKKKKKNEIVDEINKTEVLQFRKNRFYIQIKIDKLGKLEREKDKKKNLTLKDIKFELFKSHRKSMQGKKTDNTFVQPPAVVNENVQPSIEPEESIYSSHSDIEELKLNEKDSVQWQNTLDIEIQE